MYNPYKEHSKQFFIEMEKRGEYALVNQIKREDMQRYQREQKQSPKAREAKINVDPKATKEAFEEMNDLLNSLGQ